MLQMSFPSLQAFYSMQDNLPPYVVDVISLDSSSVPVVMSYPSQFDPDVQAALGGIDDSDYVENLAERLRDLENNSAGFMSDQPTPKD